MLLQLAHFGINSALCEEFFGTSLLGNFAVFQKNELIRAFHRTHTVGDDEYRFAFDEAGNGALDMRFVLRVEGSRRFVEEDDGRVF